MCFSLQALAVVQKASLSAAMFAPGWVYETQDKSHFFDSQDKYVNSCSFMYSFTYYVYTCSYSMKGSDYTE